MSAILIRLESYNRCIPVYGNPPRISIFCGMYVHSFAFCRYVGVYIPIYFRVASLALGQSYDCPSASEATLKDMGYKIRWYLWPCNKMLIVSILSGMYWLLKKNKIIWIWILNSIQSQQSLVLGSNRKIYIFHQGSSSSCNQDQNCSQNF